MPTTTVLHVSQADSDYILRSVETWDDVQAIAEFVGIDKADTCSRVCIGTEWSQHITKVTPWSTMLSGIALSLGNIF